jgi:hypothetical protein
VRVHRPGRRARARRLGFGRGDIDRDGLADVVFATWGGLLSLGTFLVFGKRDAQRVDLDTFGDADDRVIVRGALDDYEAFGTNGDRDV